MKKTLALTAALASTMALGGAAQAGDNPFAAASLAGGYQLAQADTKPMDDKGDMKPMEGKAKDGSCGGKKKADGTCAGKKKADASCGSKKKGDASCGASKKN